MASSVDITVSVDAKLVSALMEARNYFKSKISKFTSDINLEMDYYDIHMSKHIQENNENN